MGNRASILLAVVAALGGCANPVTMSDPTRGAKDEGVIVYRVKCGPGIAWGQIFHSGENPSAFNAQARRAGILSCRDGMQTQRLPAGRYFVGKIGFRGVVDFNEEAAMQFSVAAGQLSYIGHVTLPSNAETGDLLISTPFVSDRRDEALTWLAANGASSQGPVEVVTALAQSPSRQTTNGAEQRSASDSAAEFTVVLKLRVAEDGSVREGHIAQSSGNVSLDDAALAEAVHNWQVTSATEGGASVAKWGHYSVTYRSTN